MEMDEKLPIDDIEAANREGNVAAPPSYGGTDGAGNEPPTYQQATGPNRVNPSDNAYLNDSEDEGVQFYDLLDLSSLAAGAGVDDHEVLFTKPPPSYQSLFGEIKEARQSASSVFDFLKKLFVLLIGTIGCTIALGIIMAIPITMIVIGAKYKDDCTVEKYIPIYLIVGGSFGILRNIISLCQRAKKSGSSDEESQESRKNPLSSILDCFLFAWFIAGNVWIYSNYEPNYIPGSKPYCNKTLYLFAFWLTNATYILMGVTCLCVCCAGICAVVAS